MQPVYFHVSQSYACRRVVSLNLMAEFSTVLICLSLHCRKTKYPDLHKWFCVDTIKVCCPKGTFGPDCNGNVDSRKYCQEPCDKVAVVWSACAVCLIVCTKDCVGGSDRPCHGNGMCDGDGTRGGNGKCTCGHGYNGEFCLDCIDGFFSDVRNDTFSLCTGVLKGRHCLLSLSLRLAVRFGFFAVAGTANWEIR